MVLFLSMWLSFSTALGQSKVELLESQLQLIEHEDSIAYLHYELGKEYMKLGNGHLSLDHLKMALAYYSEASKNPEQANVMQAIGETYYYIDNLTLAMEFFTKALDKCENANHLDDACARITNLMIDLFMRQGDIFSAEKYAQITRNIVEKSNNDGDRAQLYVNLGRISNNYKRYDSAIYYYESAARIFDSLYRYHDKGRAQHNLSNTYREMGELHKALTLCQQVLEIEELNENVKSRVFSLLLMANIYNDMAVSKKALPYARAGQELSERYGFDDRRRVALLYLSEAHENLRNYDSALFYHKQFSSVMDTVYDNAKYELIAQMNIQFETEKKEKTIELQKATLAASEATIELQETKAKQLLIVIVSSFAIAALILVGFIHQNRKNKVLLDQKLQIERQNREREVLLKEIHHRVKNNLQVISSLLNMQSRTMASQDAKNAVREGQSRIKSMALIHQKLYSEDQLSKINMKSYLSELAGFLHNTYKSGKEVNQTIDAQELLVDVDLALPLGLIVNELMSNAFKYAFDDGEKGQVILSLIKENQEYILKVSDTGKGLPEGFDNKKSMGMNLVKILVEQLNGVLSYSSHHGTMFTIRFKEPTIA